MAEHADLPGNVPVLLGHRTPQVPEKGNAEAHAEKVDTEPYVVDIRENGGRCPPWRPLTAWFQMLYATFGTFLPLAMLCYGLQQSFQRTTKGFAVKYYMMDELKLDGVEIGRLVTAGHLFWNMKPVLAMLSDAVPVCGYHRTSYLVIMCCIGISMYTWIGFFPVSTLGLLAFITLVNGSTAFSDLLVDATAAGLARSHPAQACDLQTAMRSAEATGGIISSAVKGALVSNFTPRGAIMSQVICVVAVLIPTLRGWLPEERLPAGARCTPNLTPFKQNSGLTMAGVFLAVLAMTLFATQTFLPYWYARVSVLTVCVFGILVCAHKAFHKISPYLWKTALLMFLRASFSPGLGESMFVWMSKAPNGPLFTPEQLGLADVFAQAGLLVGAVVFNKFLRKWKYRQIFFFGQLLVAIIQLMDLILVLRWNRAIGLPDILFFVGDEAFDKTVQKTFDIPLVVLAYKVCPSHLEATIFSTLIAMSSIGVDCGKYLGVALAEVWGIVDGNFDHLPHGIISKTLIRLVPIPFILILSPDFTPDDPIPSCEESERSRSRHANEMPKLLDH